LPISVATAKGHIKQERQNLQSTKTMLEKATMSLPTVKTEEESEDFFQFQIIQM